MLDAARRLRDAFLEAGYTAEGVGERLGPMASDALGRGEVVPALRATGSGDVRDTLIRMFLLQRPVPYSALKQAFPLEAAQAAGMLRVAGTEVRAALDVRPYGSDDGPPEGWWVVSDLSSDLAGAAAPVAPDHVLGIGGASTTLAQVTVRRPVRRALDLGTGCGVQSLHLSRHSETVVATDVLPRALALTRLTAALSGLPEKVLDLREGSLFAPVRGERFDLVVSNPPFVVHPRRAEEGERFAYRDSGLAGDEVCRRLVRDAPAHLAPGGWAQLLANWAHVRGEDWQERVGSWLSSPGDLSSPGAERCDAWVVQREVQDPAAYVGLWLRDSGEVGSPEYERRYDSWLAAFEEAGIEAVGFGWIALHRTDAERASVRIEDWPHAVEQPLGAEVLRWGRSARWLAELDDAALLAARLSVAGDVRQEQSGDPGAEDPQVLLLRQQRGMRRADRVDTATAAVAGACDGSVPLGRLIDAVAELLETPAEQLRALLLPALRELVAGGTLQPAGHAGAPGPGDPV